MDLELQRDTVSCYDLVLDTTVCQEETQEAIVPDACPDILRVLDVQAQGCLNGKQVRDGGATVTGMVRACVLYLPESGEGIRRIEIALPFTCMAEAQGLSVQGNVVAVPRVRWAEARILNPRKVLLRVDLAVEIQAYQPAQLEVCCGTSEMGEQGIRQLLENENADINIAIQEKPFTFTETIDFGMPGTDRVEVLSIRGEPHCSECKLIGSKLIFKGMVDVQALVMAGTEVKEVRQSMAFSQIMEAAGTGEDSACQMRIALADLTLQEMESMSGTGEVTLELLAQAVVRERRRVTILQDLYSTNFLMDVKSQMLKLTQILDQGSRTVPVRELMETTTAVRTICCAWADLGEVRTMRDGEQTALNAEVQISVLYLDDGEQMQSVHRTFPVQCKVEAPGGSACRAWCSDPDELFVNPAAGGLEVRFSLDFHCQICMERRVGEVTAACLGDERSRSNDLQPSVVLRLPEPGERLWDIAKSCGTTTEEIIQANELEEGEVPSGRMLLIPRIR